ncbi:MAG: protein kinase [Myxococcota bacterium]
MRFPSVPELRGVEVLTRLHRGGMGDVFLGRLDRPPGFGRWVALKVIRLDLRADAGVRTMFLDEARVLASLEHPAIAQVVDFGEADGTPYLLLEYVAGLSFSLIRSAGPLPPPVAARMVAGVARGLHSAHEATDSEGRPLGIVHRDISPQNAMLTFKGRVKLLDFGIAMATERQSARTATGILKGKLAYVAPEQIVGSPADRASDTYSLCIVLHELLTGRTLFEASDNLLDAAKERRRPPRVSSRQVVPRKLERIVMKGLAERREGRWSDALQLAEALEEFAHRAGGDSLEGYADRALAKARTRHAAWLRAQAASTEAPTIPAGEEAMEVPSELIEVVEVASPPRLPPADRYAGRRVLRAAFVVAALLMAGGLAYRLNRTPVSSESADGSEAVASSAPATKKPAWTAPGAPSSPSTRVAGAADPPRTAEAPASEPPASERSVRPAGEAPASGALPAPTPEPPPARTPEAPPARTPEAPPARTPEAPPAAPVRTRPAPAPGPGESLASSSEVASARRTRGRWGRLSLSAPEGGFVVIDGEAFGRTPLDSRKIRAGPHVVELRWSGESDPRWSQEIMVRERVHVVMTAAGRVTVAE